MTRVQLLRADVRAEIDGATDDRRRRMAIGLARYVAANTLGLPAELQSLVATIAEPTDDMRRTAEMAADRLDAHYLGLHDDEKPGGQTPGWEVAFRVARAAQAIAWALDPDPLIAVTEAAYEARHALGDDEDVVARVLGGVAESSDIAER
jgi:hypothetical protein